MRRIGVLIVLALALGVGASGQTVISNVYVSTTTATTATIVWTTSTPATSLVRYGYNNTLPYQNNTNYTLVTSHSMTLTVLNASQPYYFAVVSVDGGGHTTQSSTYEFALCGNSGEEVVPPSFGTVPVTGTVNFAYGNGTYTLNWNPPSGSGGTPTVCGHTVATTVTGTLNTSGSFNSQVADSLKVTPGPGTWTVHVADPGNIAPISSTQALSVANQDVSAPLQAAAGTAGLVQVIANASTCYPAFVCTGAGAVAPPAFSVQFANIGATGFQSDSTFNFTPSTHTLSSQNMAVSSLTSGDCVQAVIGGLLGVSSGPCGIIFGQTTGVLPLATGVSAIGAQSHLDDGVTTANTITSNESLNARSVNTVYDLQAAFGASGSNQTMTCTATASSNNLTSCSGGDFKVGQWVYIPGAGTTTGAASAPVISATTCSSGNGGSCTGSTVYSYEIVAVQGAPNGIMSAPSTAGTVTQAAQTKVDSGSWVTTTVTWSATSGASIYIVYKSVNGGPYNYYAMTFQANTFVDNGYWLSTEFSCTDDAIPCTAPAGANPNDIFAQISAIVGSTYTLAAGTYQPSYRTGTGLSGVMPFIPATSGTFTVQHDDSPAFTAAYAFFFGLSSPGQHELHIPAGTYNTHNECYPGCNVGNPVLFSIAGLKNFSMVGDGNSSYVSLSNDRASKYSGFIGGQCAGGAVGFCSHYYAAENVGPGAVVKVLTEPIPAGSKTVALATPSDISGFPVGTWVTIFPNNQTFPCGRGIDLNQVLNADPITGILTLAYPVARYYATSLPAPWSGSGCSYPPVIAPIVGGLTASNISFKNFHLRGDTQFSNVNTVDNLMVSGLWLQVNITENSGQERHITYQDNTIEENGNAGFTLYGILTAAYGDTDKTAIRNTYTTGSYSALAAQNCVESSANIAYLDNSMTFSGIGRGASTQTNNAAIAAIGPCFNFKFMRNKVQVINSDMKYLFRLDAGQVVTVVKDNDISVDSVSASGSASIYSQAIFGAALGNRYVSNNNWVISAGAAGAPLISPVTQISAGVQILNVGSVSTTVNLTTSYGTANVIATDYDSEHKQYNPTISPNRGVLLHAGHGSGWNGEPFDAEQLWQWRWIPALD